LNVKRLMLAIGLVLGAAILGSALLAQPPGRMGRGGPPGGGGPSPVLAALDANGDGELSAKEIDNAAAALRTLDKNKDGKLTRDELLPAPRDGGQGGPSPAELVTRMMALDKNGDGKLSKDELPERMRNLLERADVNKDGLVDKDELTRLAQQQAGRRQAPGPATGRGGFRPREEGRGPGEDRGRDQEQTPKS
jgi:Ca2+-binding EF-hand superfamily protein